MMVSIPPHRWYESRWQRQKLARVGGTDFAEKIRHAILLKFAVALDERLRDPLPLETLAWDLAVNLDVAYLFTDDEYE